MASLPAAQSQQVFRAVLDVLARPGTVAALPAGTGYPAALLPLLALADLSTPVCVLEDGGSWAGVVRAETSAPLAALSHARLVAALRPAAAAELALVRTGTAAAPEDGALVTLVVDGLSAGGGTLALDGPGTGGPRELGVTGLPDGFAAARRELTSQFPAGADFLLVAPDGSIAGLPRTTQARSLEKEAVLWGTPVCGAAWTPSSRPSASSGPAASGRRG